MGKRILIVGGSHAELPLIESAHNRGDYVITTGNNVDGLGHVAADKYVEGDFSDKEFVYRIASEEKVDCIVSGCNDFSYLSTAYACDKLGLPGHDSYETAKTIHQKNNFRKLMAGIGVKTPKIVQCIACDDVIEACREIGFPVVVKSVDLTGGKGVQICYNVKQAKEAYINSMQWTREKFVIVEELITGSNHGVSVLIRNQKIVFGFVDNEQYYINKYLVSGACFPSDVTTDTIDILYRDIEKMAEKLKLVDGLFHAQFIIDKEGYPIMIDPCRRAPGDLYILLVKYATGIDYPLEILKAECGEQIGSHYSVRSRNIARECIMTNRNGKFHAISFHKSIKNFIFEQLIWAYEGEVIDNYRNYKAGIIFLECEQREKLYEVVENFHDLVTIEAD